jgi:hypothetical protein
VPLRPFKIGAQLTDDEVYDQTITTNASTQRYPLYNVPSTAFLNDIYMLVEATTAANAATVTFAADGPWIVLDTVKFTDTNNAEIITPVTGWELYVINKYGGYNFSDDPKAIAGLLGHHRGRRHRRQLRVRAAHPDRAGTA